MEEHEDEGIAGDEALALAKEAMQGALADLGAVYAELKAAERRIEAALTRLSE